MQKRKLQNLLKILIYIFSDSRNPDRVIFNFSLYELTDDAKNGLCKGLNDNSKFSRLDIPAGKEISHIVNLEKRITSELKLLKDKEIIDKSTYKSIKPVGSRPDILYGSSNIHKETRNGLPPFRNGLPPFCPILSAIDTPT